MKVLFLYNSVSIEEKYQNYALGECASCLTVEAVYEALMLTGSEICPLNLHSPAQLEETVGAMDVDAAFVIAEGFLDFPHTLYDGTGAMMIREILNRYKIPSSHSSPEVMKLCRNKNYTYERLYAYGINVPSFFVVPPDRSLNLEEQIDAMGEGSFPLFVKPVGGGSSICIDESSVVNNREELVERIKVVQSLLENQPVLVETYLPGREYTIGVLGNGERYVLPVIGFSPDAGVRSAADKGIFMHVDSELEILPAADPVSISLMNLGGKIFDILGTRDIIRIDVKEDSQGICRVIDVNGTPSLAPASSIIKMAAAAGIGYQEVVALVLYAAVLRENLSPPAQLTEMVAEPLRKLTLLQGNMVA